MNARSIYCVKLTFIGLVSLIIIQLNYMHGINNEYSSYVFLFIEIICTYSSIAFFFLPPLKLSLR